MIATIWGAKVTRDEHGLTASVQASTDAVRTTVEVITNRSSLFAKIGVDATWCGSVIQAALPELCAGVDQDMIAGVYSEIDHGKRKSGEAMRLMNATSQNLTNLQMAFHHVLAEVTQAEREKVVRWTMKRIKPHTRRLKEVVDALKTNTDEQRRLVTGVEQDQYLCAMKRKLTQSHAAVTEAQQVVDGLDSRISAHLHKKADAVGERLRIEDRRATIHRDVMRLQKQAVALESDVLANKHIMDRANQEYNAAILKKNANVEDICQGLENLHKKFLAKEQKIAQEQETQEMEHHQESKTDRSKLKELRLQYVRGGKCVESCHFILACDRSGSMGGPPFEALMQALDCFRAATVQGQHVVSLVAFDHECLIISKEMALGSFDPKEMLRFPPRGGTNYAPAWDKITDLVRSGDPIRQPIVLFMTDGCAGDVKTAGTKAESLFNAQKGCLATFLIPLGVAVDGSFLSPILLGGNGGRSFMMSPRGSRIDFLMPTNVAQICTVFEQVAVSSDQALQEMRDVLDEYEQEEQKVLKKTLQDRLLKSRAQWQRQVEQQNDVMKIILEQDDKVIAQKLKTLAMAQESKERAQKEIDTVNEALQVAKTKFANETKLEIQGSLWLKEASAASGVAHTPRALGDGMPPSNPKGALPEEGSVYDSVLAGLQEARVEAIRTLNNTMLSQMKAGVVANEKNRMVMHHLFLRFSGLQENERILMGLCSDTFQSMYGWIHNLVVDIEQSVDSQMSVNQKVLHLLDHFMNTNRNVSLDPGSRHGSFLYILRQIANDNLLDRIMEDANNVTKGINAIAELWEIEDLIAPTTEPGDGDVDDMDKERDLKRIKAEWSNDKWNMLRLKLSSKHSEVNGALQGVRRSEKAFEKAKVAYKKAEDQEDNSDDKAAKFEEKREAERDLIDARRSLEEVSHTIDWAKNLLKVVMRTFESVLESQVIRQELKQMKKRVDYYKEIIDAFVNPLIGSMQKATLARTEQANEVPKRDGWRALMQEQEIDVTHLERTEQ